MTVPHDLAGLLRERARLAAASERRARVGAELAAERARYAVARTRLREATAALTRIEGLSVASVARFLVGARGAELALRRRAAAAARGEHDRLFHGVGALDAEAAALDADLARVPGVDARLEAALDHAARRLVAAGGAHAARMAEISEALARHRTAARELAVAAETAKDASRSLDGVLSALAEAKAHGRHDLMTEDNYAAAAAKQASIDRARAAAGPARGRMMRLNAEVRGVRVHVGSLEVEMDAWLAAADFGIDSVLVDWIVQRRIDDAIDRVRRARKHVGTMQVGLRAQLAGHRARAEALDRERRTLLGLHETPPVPAP